MKVTHDPKFGMSYIYLMDRIERGAAVRQVHAGPDVILDFDADGHLLGIELLDRKLLHRVLFQLATGS